jgi:hypothetical protein
VLRTVSRNGRMTCCSMGWWFDAAARSDPWSLGSFPKCAKLHSLRLVCNKRSLVVLPAQAPSCERSQGCGVG